MQLINRLRSRLARLIDPHEPVPLREAVKEFESDSDWSEALRAAREQLPDLPTVDEVRAIPPEMRTVLEEFVVRFQPGDEPDATDWRLALAVVTERGLGAGEPVERVTYGAQQAFASQADAHEAIVGRPSAEIGQQLQIGDEVVEAPVPSEAQIHDALSVAYPGGYHGIDGKVVAAGWRAGWLTCARDALRPTVVRNAAGDVVAFTLTDEDYRIERVLWERGDARDVTLKQLHKLVDLVWQHCTESEQVPSTRTAEELIGRALA